MKFMHIPRNRAFPDGNGRCTRLTVSAFNFFIPSRLKCSLLSFLCILNFLCLIWLNLFWWCPMCASVNRSSVWSVSEHSTSMAWKCGSTARARKPHCQSQQAIIWIPLPESLLQFPAYKLVDQCHFPCHPCMERVWWLSKIFSGHSPAHPANTNGVDAADRIFSPSMYAGLARIDVPRWLSKKHKPSLRQLVGGWVWDSLSIFGRP